MKILLLQSVKNVGKKGDIVNASDGYARNFLIPKKIGVSATEKTMHEKSTHDTEGAAMIKKLETLRENLKKETLTLTIKTGHDGSIFGAIYARDVESALAAKGFRNVKIILERPLKSLGSHEVSLDLGNGVKGLVKITLAPSA